MGGGGEKEREKIFIGVMYCVTDIIILVYVAKQYCVCMYICCKLLSNQVQ